LLRGQKVMPHRDLADLYGVRTMALKQQVKRIANRFPPDFTFRLSKEEAESLISQNVISTRRSFSRILPSASAEQSVAMLSSVLKSAGDPFGNLCGARNRVSLDMFATTDLTPLESFSLRI
jgi:hypothetical protein